MEVKQTRNGIKMTVFNNKKKAIFRSIQLLEAGSNTFMVCKEDDACNGEVRIRKVTKESDDLYWLYLVQIKWNEDKEEYEDVQEYQFVFISGVWYTETLCKGT